VHLTAERVHLLLCLSRCCEPVGGLTRLERRLHPSQLRLSRLRFIEVLLLLSRVLLTQVARNLRLQRTDLLGIRIRQAALRLGLRPRLSQRSLLGRDLLVGFRVRVLVRLRVRVRARARFGVRVRLRLGLG